MERVSGPHNGFYIATYACETGGASERYLGYSKICRRKPETYWEAQCYVKLCGQLVHRSAERAMEEVEQRAREQLLRLVRQGTETM